MEYSEQDYKIAQILYEKMKTLPIGTEISVSELGKLALEETTAEDGFIPMYKEWWPVMEALRKIMHKERKLRMDFTKHELLCEGLPFNIPFVLLKWGQRIYADEVKISNKFAKDNGKYGVKFVVYLYNKWVFSITCKPGVLVDPTYPPTYIIVEMDSSVRFSTLEESKEIIHFHRE
ncbi:hypothetical protein [Bacteroides uniformis]|jgi:hypothetical protein|uniref:Uncharacterized protein n=1 Tax=Bacteroides uniformis TaxID=820 RepID=A0A3E4R8X6_BACUN|nr:hypothetical protein [Bacteroides uniformis]RGL16324.1 hypothetical protein DXC80_03910 [Bacteroides uniformis]